MKKFLYLLLLLPLGLFASCDDGNDVPDVDIDVTFDNVVKEDGVLYVVQDKGFAVRSVTCEGIGSNALISSVTYYWDYIDGLFSFVAPFTQVFDTSATPLGNHILRLNMEVLQEGKSLGFAIVEYKVKVVASEEDIPGDSNTPGPEVLRTSDVELR